MRSLVSLLLPLLFLTPLLPSTNAQMEIMFAYYAPNSKCRKLVPSHGNNFKSQAFSTSWLGQCVPVHLDMGGTFDVRISKKFYWMNQVSPVVKGCPTELCDLDAGPDDNGCDLIFDKKKFPGTVTCLTMTNTFYWAVGPCGFDMKVMKHEGRINGTALNATEFGLGQKG